MYNILQKKRNFNKNVKENLSLNKNDKTNKEMSYAGLDTEDRSYFINNIEEYYNLNSTKIINSIDWSKFENHVFFDSAVDKVNFTFKKILNYFPYDFNESELFDYFKSVDGYEHYILENIIPKSLNYLNFDGSSYVETVDKNGYLLKDYDTKKIKTGNLNPKTSNFCFDFWLYFDNNDLNVNNDYIILQKTNSIQTSGYTIFLKKSNNKCYLCFYLNNNNNGYLFSERLINSNVFNHVCINVFSLNGNKNVEITINGEVVLGNDENNFANSILSEDLNPEKFFIGKGSSHGYAANPVNFKGSIDELRFFLKRRNLNSIRDEQIKNIYASSELVLYYRFNEPSGDYSNNAICLDYSGKKLHGVIKNNANNITTADISILRTKALNTPLVYEKEIENPVLFPSYLNLSQIQEPIINEAKAYDLENPNTFWKLFPSYLFYEASDFEKVSQIYVNSNSLRVSEEDNLKVEGDENNSLIKLLTIWSRFFDKFKIYIDAISNSFDIDYNTIKDNKNIDSFTLPLALKLVGYDIKEIFPNLTKDKYNNIRLTHEHTFSEKSIRNIQNILWKRLLINTQDIYRKKGTDSGVNAIFNSFGIEKDMFFDCREYKNQNIINMNYNYKEVKKNIRTILLTEKNNLNKSPDYSNNRNIFDSVLEIKNFGGNDFIKKDWTIEFFIKFKKYKELLYNKNHSLFKLNIEDKNKFINIVFERINDYNHFGDIVIYLNKNNVDTLIGKIENVNLLNGSTHFFSVSHKKLTSLSSNFSISTKLGLTNTDYNTFRTINLYYDNSDFYNTYDFSNCEVVFGNKVIPSLPNLLDYSSESVFQGEVFGIKFWNKNLNKEELNLHSKNSDNFSQNFLNLKESSELITQKNSLIINLSLKESADSLNELSVLDQINLKNLGSSSSASLILYKGSKVNNNPILNHLMLIYQQTSKFDFPENTNKVNILSFEAEEYRSFLKNDNLNPKYSHNLNEIHNEDIITSIDFSNSFFINKEISKMINIIDTMTNLMFSRNNLYAEDYHDLETLQKLFFEKLEKEINYKPLYQIYKYFDNILKDIIKESIPSKSNFLGLNYVYESHDLERHKYQYKNSDSRMPIVDFNYYSYIEKDYYVRNDHNKPGGEEEAVNINNNIFNIE